MIDIKLKDGQTGYEAVAEYIHRYWDHNYIETVIISMGVSYNGKMYNMINEIACPCDGDIEYLYDWWEGEEFIRLFGIKAVDEIEISGGLYE